MLEGSRASAKTALGRMPYHDGHLKTIADLSDPTILDVALAAPSTFVDNLVTPALIDEAQLAPDLLLPTKRASTRTRVRARSCSQDRRAWAGRSSAGRIRSPTGRPGSGCGP